MSLNEIAVDLTCHPEPFQPAETDFLEEIDSSDSYVPGRYREHKERQQQEMKTPPYFVHSGMLRMAKAMGDVGKPVQVAVLEALYHNPGFGTDSGSVS
jgi:hypothetical protein